MINDWYKKVIVENKNKILNSIIISLLFLFSVSLWMFLSGKKFEWREISPISKPSIFIRLFYSALVFVTLGAFLYYIKFYRFLYGIMVKFFKDKRGYRDVKKIIWTSLILLMYGVIVPAVVNILNTVISFCYNIWNLIFYLLPPVGILFMVIVLYFLFKKYKIEKECLVSITK